MKPDETVVIERSPVRLLLQIVIGVVTTALSAAIVFMPDIHVAYLGIFLRTVGFLGVLFCGLGTGIAFRRLVATAPVITISPDGVRDYRVAADPIPWSVITDISTWEYSGQRFMVLAVKPGTQERLGLTRMARWTRAGNRLIGADGLCITANGTKIDHDTLVQICEGYLERYGAGAG